MNIDLTVEQQFLLARIKNEVGRLENMEQARELIVELYAQEMPRTNLFRQWVKTEAFLEELCELPPLEIRNDKL